MTEEALTYTDAFCGETLTEGVDDILVLTVRRRSGRASQDFYMHRDCLAHRLIEDMPLGEVFEPES